MNSIFRITTTAALAGSFIVLTACGPTKTGIEARENARARLDSVHAGFTYEQARQSFEVGQLDEAQHRISRAIERYPENPSYFILSGRIHLEANRLENAKLSFERSIELDPESAEAFYYLGIVHQRWSEHVVAYENYMAAFELERSNPQFLLAAAESMVALGELDKAAELLEANMAYFEHNSAMRQLQAQIAFLQGDSERSAELYSQARLLNPEDISMLEEQAWIQFDAKQYARSLESLRQLQMAMKEDREDLQHLEARCLSLLERNSEARKIYIRLTQKAPTNVEYWIELGKIAWDMGDYRRVAQCSVRIIALAPDRHEGYMLKGVNENHHGNTAEAIDLLGQAADRAPVDTLPHILLGHTLEKANQLAAAHRSYENALAVDPSNNEARMLLQRLESSQRVTSVDVQSIEQ